jgi:hypothetical protein
VGHDPGDPAGVALVAQPAPDVVRVGDGIGTQPETCCPSEDSDDGDGCLVGYRAAVELSSPARQCMRVDLPEPDGPMIAVSLSEAKETSTPASAVTAVGPLP